MVLTLIYARRAFCDPDPEYRRDTFELLFGRRFEEVGNLPAAVDTLCKVKAKITAPGDRGSLAWFRPRK